ncbi:hypothetical protein JW872_00045 [Candidatus Babeliales bacterium]|nr:hypothetical protein [Candidatus Babeliales bacterium]
MTSKVFIPADVPQGAHAQYCKNYQAITYENGRLFLFAADQKIEHLNSDFAGKTIPKSVNNPKHLFEIAQQGSIGAFATHLGLIARYGPDYSDINYIVKLNGKTNIVPTTQRDPLSTQLWSVDDVITFQKSSGLKVRGIGYTVYLGSEYESVMLTQAAQTIISAHRHGLVAILWVYPRGKAVKEDRSDALISGATGVAAALGADFVKINPPRSGHKALKTAVHAAGMTKVICTGGHKIPTRSFLKQLNEQLTKGNTFGCAVGRNIFSHELPRAIDITYKIAELLKTR